MRSLLHHLLASLCKRFLPVMFASYVGNPCLTRENDACQSAPGVPNGIDRTRRIVQAEVAKYPAEPFAQHRTPNTEHPIPKAMDRFVILTEGHLGVFSAKTATSLMRYRPHEVV